MTQPRFIVGRPTVVVDLPLIVAGLSVGVGLYLPQRWRELASIALLTGDIPGIRCRQLIVSLLGVRCLVALNLPARTNP